MDPVIQSPDVLSVVLKTWQAVETSTIARAEEMIATTKSPIVQLFMEIVRHDAEMHRRVQQVILDTLGRQGLALTGEEKEEIREIVMRQAAMERYTVELGEHIRESCRLLVRCQMLDYLAAGSPSTRGRVEEASHATV